ncbi:MAG: hypothetical protein US94_C0004G0012 [Berkelbacteria bacterium GW2011_GWB1_38_5]|uniref:Uncharacterized protein n=2 Tax=Candidatus Berkelbacteria TaxID=1618330 RepID=A0A0G0PN41_9BACT|nr:MAG: hypothetical protein US94_C0004G0012 [Berkelbacteria bacterium GW2011_GWB1_38_5]KKQ90711.1 MAG: hypothetical protein UT15_C0006G0012 [Berkelbacteria bacterium GW2011_GWA1_39_10]
MMRRTLSICSLVLIMMVVMTTVSQASWLSHGIGELDKLVRGESYTMNFPGMVIQATEYLPAGTSHPALATRPHPEGAYFLQGVVVRFDITFLTGDYEGRPGQVMFSDSVKGISVKDLLTEGAKDSGGMELVTTFRKETKRISFVWDTTGYPQGSFTYLVELFPRSKSQKYSEIAIPVFLAASFGEVKEALKDASDGTLKRYGLERYSQVMEARKSPKWLGDIAFTDGSRLRQVDMKATPQVGMAVCLVYGSEILGGGRILSVNGTSVKTDMPPGVIHGRKADIFKIEAKFANRVVVRTTGKRTLSSDEEKWVQGFPETVGGNPRNQLRFMVRELLALDVVHVGPRQNAKHYFALFQAVSVAKECWIPIDIPVAVAERISVIGWANDGAPVLNAKELAREQAKRPGLVTVLWNLTQPKYSNSLNSKSASSSAAASSSSSEATNTTDVNQQQQQQQQQQVGITNP